MSPRRPGRKKTARPPRPTRAKVPPSPERGLQLQYKVVELSTVDEHSLEQTVNRWVRQGWNLDGVQFAMRESSKRPSMAFVFFTRDDAPVASSGAEDGGERAGADAQGQAQAQARLRRLASDSGGPGGSDNDAPPVLSQVGPRTHDSRDERTWPDPPMRSADPWLRLQQLAGEDGDDDPEDSGTGSKQ